MPSLFTFNDAYVSAVAGGANDEDVVDLLAEAFDEMGREVEEQLPDEFEMHWDDEGPYVVLNRQELADEFGTADRPGQGNVQRAFIHSELRAQRAFQEVLHG